MEQKRFIKNILSKKINTDRRVSNLKKYVSLNSFKQYLNFSESYNDKANEITFGKNCFFYSYQRHDLKFNCDHWLKFLYNIDIKEQSMGLFFTSCMASISVLFMVFKQYNYNRIVFSNLPYFEAYDFAEKVFSQANVKEIKNLTKKSVDVLYICSASPTFLSVDYRQINTKCIVFDSSCVDCSNDYIKKLVDYCCKNNIKLLLVRSNMKLDCFGLEINRLGSLVCLNCDKNFIDSCNELSIYFGNKAPLKDIYLWLGEQEFFEITTKNINKVLRLTNYSSNLLDKLLNKDKFEVINFDNGIYFVIKLKQKVDNLDKLNRTITGYCQKSNLPIKTSASFYLEQVGLDNFVRRLDNDNQFLRISLSAYVSKKDTTEIIKKIAEYLNNVKL